MVKRKNYQLTLRVMGPLHIGSGKIYTQKEYIYENGFYYFPDMGSLYKEIRKQGDGLTSTFEEFLMQNRNGNHIKPRLIQFLNDQKISTRDFDGYRIKEHGFELEKKKTAKGNLNEISAFVKDPYGYPYIPGSSLKGAIRTILVNEYFHTDNIPWGPKAEADDIFHNIHVSDSEPISLEQLILAQKWDFSPEKLTARSLPIHRESLKPMTAVHFTVTAVGDRAIQLIDQLPQFAKKYYQKYTNKFLVDFPARFIQTYFWSPIYLGAGSGFWTKTDITKADNSRYKKRGKMSMKGKGVLKLTKAPMVKYRLNGKSRQLIENSENLYEMGKCVFSLKEGEK
ncbi:MULTISPECIES: type III-A CRISPR-associated RAMP protein Csm5 [Tetragenococcus]|uniref:CRISPR system Cms protein Csm5 n=2 Tax=Tetragenococcus muriaticus TaxID=64642 RepID=A0A091CDY8_9ENTE|nr:MULTISPECIES: type III-A CRISPR-associated RAMP protein Csm5 [Tetragenococcus]KFN92558.1 CRISPR-associated Csm5 family protein [Tetragenococcus muriaticus 3MR10-3]KFN93311.1 CRISPR-associated Csm5 family protein [Tetragenococcus muriaticus PMC-11-5]MCF1613629.1 type III-A CRISPR-associated RAMP protein Csm5 [Tetragenococcus koreensis]MCF1623375.1 type III-A CRISPR-associated RAMP protein Csm5 [Tetragenococcus koreensis]